MVLGPRAYRVLIVEDEADHATVIEAVFSQLDADARLTVMGTAEEAIAYLRGPWPDTDYGHSEPPDVIVLDITLPGIDGLGFLEWYTERADLTPIPVVVFTSSSDPDLPKRCFALGAREFKVKPLDFSELVEVVQRVLGHWRPESEQAESC